MHTVSVKFAMIAQIHVIIVPKLGVINVGRRSTAVIGKANHTAKIASMD